MSYTWQAGITWTTTGANKWLQSPQISRNVNDALAATDGCDNPSKIIGNTACNTSGCSRNQSDRYPVPDKHI